MPTAFFDRQKAKADGLSDAQINQLIAEKEKQGVTVIDLSGNNNPPPENQPVDQENQPQITGGGDKENFLMSLARAIVHPFTKTEQTIAGGLIQAPVAALSQGKINTRDIPLVGPALGLSNEELKKYETDPVEQVLRQAGRSAAVAASGLGGSGFLKGGALGATQALGDENVNPTNIALAALTGGIGGKVLGSFGGDTVKETGEDLISSVVRPNLSKSPFAYKEEQAIGRGLTDLGITGSARNQQKMIPKVMEDLSNKIKPLLSEDEILSAKGFKQSIIDFLESGNAENYVPGDSSYQKIRDRVIALIGKGKDELSEADVFLGKQKLGKQLSKAFQKVKDPRASALTNIEAVKLDIWKKLDDFIGRGNPEVKNLTNLQSLLFDAAPGVNKQARAQLRLPLVGSLPGLMQPLKAVQNFSGRGLRNFGSLAEKAGATSSNLTTLGGLAANPLLKQFFGGGEQTPQSAPPGQVPQEMSPENQSVYEELHITPTQPKQSFNDLGITPELVQAAYIALPKAKADRIKAAYDATKETAANAKRISEVQRAESLYNQLIPLALESEAGMAGFARAIAGKTPGVEGGAAEDLDRFTSGAVKTLAGAFSNEPGNPSDNDIRRWRDLLPKTGDTREERMRALKRMRDEINSEKKRLGLTR